MTIDEIFQEQDLSKRIDALQKGRGYDLPNVSDIIDEWDPDKHDIQDASKRPDKIVYIEAVDDYGNTIDDAPGIRTIEKVARISLALQKIVVKRAVSFLFGNPVRVTSENPESKVLEEVKSILKSAKINAHNRKLARHIFTSTEAAEYWYPVKSNSGFKFKAHIFSPLKGDELYPYFDETGDMIAFSRRFKKKEDSKEVEYFETWRPGKYERYRKAGTGWEEERVDVSLPIDKIPIIYARQDAPEWGDVQGLIDRLEKLLSNHADTNDYHASPKIFIEGDIKGFAKKGESGAILEGEKGTKASYLSWQQAPEAVKLEIDTLLRMIYTLTQTPDISFDGVKGLGNAASGQSLKMLFLDAHLKVQEKMEIFDEFFERRINVLKEFISKAKPELAQEAKDVDIMSTVTPYMVDNEETTISNLVTAVQGGIMSAETATGKNPYVENGEEEYAKVKEERKDSDQTAGGLDDIQNEEI